MTYLHHVTLSTGHLRRSPRAEVAGEVVATLRAMLGEALAAPGAAVAMPEHVQPRCTLSATAEGRCLVATVWAPPEGELRVPLATIGVAGHGRCGARLWESLHAHAAPGLTLATRGQPAPAAPWCGARLEPGIALHPQAASWLGDLERCLAWAWLERRRDGH